MTHADLGFCTRESARAAPQRLRDHTTVEVATGIRLPEATRAIMRWPAQTPVATVADRGREGGCTCSEKGAGTIVWRYVLTPEGGAPASPSPTSSPAR